MPGRLVLRRTAPAAARATRPPRRCRPHGSPIPREPLRHGRDRERRRVAARHLVPGERRRHARVRRRAGPSTPRRRCGPSRSGCSRGTRRGAPPSTTCWWRCPARGVRPRGPARRAARRTSGNVHRGSIRAYTWNPREPEVFGQPVSPKSVEHLARRPARRRRICSHADAGDRVEVDAQLVGMIEVVGAHGVRVQVDAAEVDDPRELRRVAHDDLVRGPARRERQLDRLDPLRPGLRRALLEEELPLRPVHEALQRHRPALHPAERAVRDGQVVPDEVELRVAGLGKKTLSGFVMVTSRPATSMTSCRVGTSFTLPGLAGQPPPGFERGRHVRAKVGSPARWPTPGESIATL